MTGYAKRQLTTISGDVSISVDNFLKSGNHVDVHGACSHTVLVRVKEAQLLPQLQHFNHCVCPYKNRSPNHFPIQYLVNLRTWTQIHITTLPAKQRPWISSLSLFSVHSFLALELITCTTETPQYIVRDDVSMQM